MARHGRWILGAELGGGGMGQVYRAETPAGQHVVVKHPASSLSAESQTFQDEVRFLSRLQHPNLVAFLGVTEDSREIFGEDRGPCYWMDLVEGQDILTAAAQAMPSVILQWFQECLQALAFLHGQDILHGDLSPRNILIDREGHPQLLDFGLATRASAPSELRAGTLPYVAPERWSGRHLPASDLFALGTIFYEALAQQYPRGQCRDLSEFLKTEPRPLLEVASHLAADFARFARVIDRMICLETSERFANAEAVLAALQEAPEAELRAGGPYHAAHMLGADDHLAIVEAAIRDLDKQSAVMCIHGIGGVGKTRFLKELAVECALQQIPVVEVTPATFQAGITRLLQDSAAEKAAYFFYQLDQLSATDLSALLRLQQEGIPTTKHLICMEWNDDLLTQQGHVACQRLLARSDTQEIWLKNLNAKHAAQFLRGALGPAVSEAVIVSAFEKTGGNPLMLTKVAELLQNQPAAFLNQIESLQDLVMFRLRNLSAQERQVLLALAVAHYPVTSDALYRILEGIPVHEFNQALQSLIERDFIRSGPKTSLYYLAFSFLEDALLKEATQHRVELLHEAWLHCLQDAAYPHPQRLHHALYLKKQRELKAGARLTGESLRAAGQRESALEIVSQTLALLHERDESSRLLRLKINLLNELNRFQEALQCCDEWLDRQGRDEPKRTREVKYWFLTGLNYQNLGDSKESSRRLQHCLELAATDERQRDWATRAYSLLAMNALGDSDFKKAQDFFKAALEQADPAGQQRAELCRNYAVALAYEDKWTEAEALLEESKQLYHAAELPDGVFAALLQRGLLMQAQGKIHEAEQSYQEAETIAEQLKDYLFLASVRTNQGILARKQGHLDQSLEQLSSAQDILRLLGNPNDLSQNLRHTGIAEAAAGHFEVAARIKDELSQIAATFPQAQAYAEELQAFIREWRDGVLEGLKAVPHDWDLETRLRCLTRTGNGPAITALLKQFYQKLSPGLQVSFVDRYDYRTWVLRDAVLRKEEETMSLDVRAIFTELKQLNQKLLSEDAMQSVFESLMDAAMKLASAETGFLVFQSEAAVEGPLPGFEVVVSRNIRKQELETDAYAFSLSAVKRALQSGEEVVTDNALQDERFRDAKSIQLHQLKSIVALPIHGPDGILGVFYLDHRFEQGLFEGDLLQALHIFASTAALTLQKAHLISALKASNEDLSEQVHEGADQLQYMERELKESRAVLKNQYSEIIGRSPKMIQVLSLVDRITDAKVPVWIYGESGTGKEAIARALHYNSAREKYPFVTENCSAMPESLLESELFGHKKGAFTHATTDKKGILTYADKGTIFLDEIADMSLSLQAKLLRFLQEGEVRPIGSTQVIQVDVRVVCASNRDLEQLVADGDFREDLFFRINGVTVTLPPLRERIEDLPLLATHFLEQVAAREGSEILKLAPETLTIFMNYSWPGNIRELQNTIETAVLFAEDGLITPNSLNFKPALFSGKRPVARKMSASSPTKAVDPELARLLRAIRDNAFHRGNAAKALGISRRSLYSKLEKFGVARDTETIKDYIDRHHL